MREEIIVPAPDDEQVGRACSACDTPLAPGDEAIVCPRCKSIHHLACWMQRGGCAKRGCNQVARKDLFPPKEEEPIRLSRTPAWVLWAAGIAIIALGSGIYWNAKVAAEHRSKTVSVMVPSSEDEALWKILIGEYNESPDAQKTAELLFTPGGPRGGAYEQKLLIMLAAQDGPEVVVLRHDRFELYAEKGALMPLEDVYEEVQAAGVHLTEARLNRARVGGTLYGIPHPQRDALVVVPSVSRHPGEGKRLLTLIATGLYSVDTTNEMR